MAKKTIAERRKDYRAKRDELAKRAEVPAVSDNDRMITLLVAIANSLARIEEALTRPTNPAGVPGRIGPSTLPGGDQEYISGQWHRRAGDVYANVAEPGTPNAGNVMLGTAHDDDDPSGSV